MAARSTSCRLRVDLALLLAAVSSLSGGRDAPAHVLRLYSFDDVLPLTFWLFGESAALEFGDSGAKRNPRDVPPVSLFEFIVASY